MAERKPRGTAKKPAPRKRTNSKTNPSKSRQLTILGGVLAAFLILVLGVYLGMKAAGSGDKPKPPKEVKPPVVIIEKQEKLATLEDADKAVKVALYDNSIEASAVKAKKLEEGTTPIVTYTIELKKTAHSDVIKSMRKLFKDLGFKTTSKGDFSASNDECGIIVIFIEPKAQTDEPKVQTDEPKTQTEKDVSEKPTTKPSDKPVVEKPIILPANAPTLAIVIDDCGYSLPLAKRLAALKFPVTFAIIPHTEFDAETAKIARNSKHTVFLHFPMEPLSYPEFDPGQGTVLTNMPPALIEAQANNNVKQIGKIDGFNNHTGSAYTENKVKMQQLLGYMQKHTDTFLDSWTSPKSVAYQTCLELGMKCAVNRKFLDNENDEAYIRAKMAEGIEQAKKTGSTIMIGHLRENTVRVLEKYGSDIEKAGVRVVPVTQLTHKKK